MPMLHIFPESVGRCPSLYPFSFDSGKQCCKYQTNGNGTLLLLESPSCENDESQPCAKMICHDNLSELHPVMWHSS